MFWLLSLLGAVVDRVDDHGWLLFLAGAVVWEIWGFSVCSVVV